MDNSLSHSENLGELATALAKAQAELKPAAKESEGQVGHQRYKYADLSGCLEALRDVLPKYGLSLVQGVVGDGVNVGLSTMLLHASGQWIRGCYTAEAKDKAPQTIGSVITYLRRYTSSAMVGLSAADDDGHAAQPGSPGQRVQEGQPGAPGRNPTEYYWPSKTDHRAWFQKEMETRKVPRDFWENISKAMDGKRRDALDFEIDAQRAFA